MSTGPSCHHVDLDFIAPVPRGHRAQVLQLTRDGGMLAGNQRASVVCDLNSGVIYAPRALLDLLRTHFRSPDALPRALQAGGWTVVRHGEGSVLAAVVTTADQGKFNQAWTRLLLGP